MSSVAQTRIVAWTNETAIHSGRIQVYQEDKTSSEGANWTPQHGCGTCAPMALNDANEDQHGARIGTKRAMPARTGFRSANSRK